MKTLVRLATVLFFAIVTLGRSALALAAPPEEPNPAEIVATQPFNPAARPTDNPVLTLTAACEWLADAENELAKMSGAWDEDSNNLSLSLADEKSCEVVRAAIDYCRDPIAVDPRDFGDLKMGPVLIAGSSINLVELQEALKTARESDPDAPLAKPWTCNIQEIRKSGLNEIDEWQDGPIGAGGLALFGAKFQEQAVEALSKFLIKRARAEGLQWFGDRVTTHLCRGDQGPGPMFPNTCAALGAHRPDTKQQGPISWSMVRQAAISDLRGLPPILLTEVLGRSYPSCGESNEDACVAKRDLARSATVVFGASWNTAQSIIAGETPLETIAGLEPYVAQLTAAMGPDVNLPIAGWLEILGTVADVTRVSINSALADDKSESKGWEPTNTELREVAGLVIARHPDSQAVDFFRCTGVNDAGCSERRLDLLRVLLIRLQRLTVAVNAAEKERGEDERQKILDALGGLFTATADMLRELDSPGGNKVVSCAFDEPQANECAIVLLDGAAHVIDMVNALMDHRYTVAVEQFMIWYARQGDLTLLPPWFERYLPFIAELASAKDAAAMEEVLESVAAPVGSYKLKRGSVFPGLTEAEKLNRTTTEKRKLRQDKKIALKPYKKKAPNMYVSINAYVGVRGGGEYLLGAATAGHFGPTASIGVELGRGIGKSGSIGLYVPLLDVGMLGDFRISGAGDEQVDDEEVKATATVGFAQVFSPGLYLVFGLGNTPLALGLGAQFAPALRTTVPNDPAIEDGKQLSALRFGLFLGVDIPVWLFR